MSTLPDATPSDALMPCPRCASENCVTEEGGPYVNEPWQVRCDGCGLDGGAYWRLRSEAIAWWNTRAPRPSLALDPEAMERAARMVQYVFDQDISYQAMAAKITGAAEAKP